MLIAAASSLVGAEMVMLCFEFDARSKSRRPR